MTTLRRIALVGFCAGLFSAAMSLSVMPLHAATVTWDNDLLDGDDTNFNNAANWSGGSGVPGAADNATFTGAKAVDPNLTASDNILGLTFSTAASSGYTLSSSDPSTIKLTLTNTGTTSSSAINAANTSGTNTISAPIILGGAAATTATFTQATGGTLVVSGNITSTNAITGLALATGGVYTLSGTNSFNGTTTLNGATLNIGSNSALGTGALVINSANAIIDASGGDRVLTNAMTLSNSFAFGGTNNLTLGAIPAFAADRTITLNSTTGKTLTVGTVTNSSNADRTLTVNGAAGNKLILSGLQLAPNTATAARVFTTNGTGTIEITGPVTNGTAAFNHEMRYFGTGTIILSGASTYAGTTRVISGTMQLTGSLNSATYLRIGQSGAASGKFVLGGASGAVNQTVARFDNPQDHGTSNVLAGGASTNSILTINSTTTDSFNGLIGGPGTNENNIGITKAGTGTLNISAANTYNGPTTVQGGALNISGAQTGNGGVSVTGGTLTVTGALNGTGAISMTGGQLTVSGSGSVNGTSGITMNGSGAKLLYTSSNPMTSTIPITLTQGTIDGTGTIGAVSVGDNSANIVANGNAASGALTMSSLAFGGDATVNVRTSSPGIVVTGALSTTPANGAVQINPTPVSGIWLTGLNPLINYGSFGGAITDFTLGTVGGALSGRQTGYGGLVNTGTSIALQVDGESVVWGGAGGDGGLWKTVTTGDNTPPNNWATFSAHTATNFWADDSVQFNDTYNAGGGNVAPATTTATIQGGVNPSSVIFNNSAVNYTIASNDSTGITSGSVTKNGTGTATINTANSYTGGTTFNAGGLNVGNAGALGSGPITIATASAKTLDNTSGGPLTLSTTTQTWGGDFTFTGSNDLTMGSGAVTLGGTNRTVTVNGSTLTVGAVNGGSTTGLTVNGAGTLALANSTIAALSGGGKIANNAANNATLTVNQSTNTTYSGTLSNGTSNILGLTKQGSGTLTLSGANSYTGSTAIQAGTLVEANPQALGNTLQISFSGTTTALDIATNGGETAYPITMASGANITIVSDRATPGPGIDHPLDTFNGTATTDNTLGTGTINFTSGANVTSGIGSISFAHLNMSAGSGTTTLLNPTTANVIIGSVAKNRNNPDQTLDLGGTSSGNQITGVISNILSGGTNTAIVSLAKSNTSTWTLSGDNTYTGTTAISGGTLNVGNGGTSGTLGTGAVSNTATINFNRSNTVTVPNAITGAGIINQNGSGTLALNGSVANSVKVNSGTLDGTGSIGATTVADNASIVLANGNGGTGALTMSSLTFLGDATVNVRTASPGIVITNALTTTPASGTVTINPTPTSGSWANGANNLISYGSFGGSISNFTLGTIGGTLGPRQASGGLALNGNNIALNILGDTPKWSGADNGLWKVGATGANKNWKLQIAGTATDYISGDNVIFDDSATGTTTINIDPANVTPTSVIFNNTNKNYTIASSGASGIAGSTGISKTSTGSVTISTNNTFSGPITLQDGTLTLAGSNTSSAATTINPKGVLQLDFSAATAPVSNILGSSSPVSINSGTLNVIAKSSAPSDQTVASLSLAGGAAINVTGDSGANPTVLNVNAITRNAGASVVFTLPTGNQDAFNGVTTTNTNNATGMLGPWATVSSPGAGAANSPSGYTFATVLGGNIIPYTSATSSGAAYTDNATVNYDITATSGTFGASRAANTLRWVLPAAATQGNNQTVTTNAFMNAGGGALTFNTTTGNGKIQPGSTNELILGAAAANLTMSVIVQNNGANAGTLTVTGPNTVTLTAANTYTGPTNVNSGVLRISSTGTINSSSAVNVNGINSTFAYDNISTPLSAPVNVNGCTVTGTGTINTVNVANGPNNIVANGDGTAAALSIGSLTFSGAGKMSLKVDTSSPTSASLITGSLTANGAAGSVLVDAAPQGSWAYNTTYNLASYSGSIGGTGFSAFAKGTITGISPRVSTTLGNSGSAITLAVGAAAPIVWTGGDNSNWVIGTTGPNKNWKLQSNNSPTDFLDLDQVVFDDSGGGAALNISGAAVNVSGATFNNTVFYSINGAGIASGSLVKNNTGTLAINCANTYAGGTTFNGGRLFLHDAGALGTGALTIGPGNAKTLDNMAGPLTLSGNIAQFWNDDFAYGGIHDLDMGTGAVTLSGATRTVTVNTTRFTVGAITGASTTLGVNGAGTLVIPNSTVGGLSGNGNIANSPAAAATLTVNMTGNTTFSGVLADGTANTLGLTRDGTGTLTLSGANTYTGITAIHDGSTIVMANAFALGTIGATSLVRFTSTVTPATLDIATDGPNTAYRVMMASNSTINLVSNRATVGAGIDHQLSTANDGILDNFGGGTINFLAGSNVNNSGTASISFDRLNVGSGAAATTILNPTTAKVIIGTMTKGKNASAQTIELSGTNTGNQVTGAIADGTNAAQVISIAKSGTSTWTLAGDSTYTGGTTISGGTLLVNNTTGSGTGTGAVTVNGGTLGGSGSISGAVTVNTGGTLAPGASIESLDVASLLLNTGSILSMELGAPGTSDLINVTNSGGLDMEGGSVSLSNAGGMAAGTYTLIDYLDSFSGSLTNLGTPTGPAGFSYALQNNATNTSIELVVTATGIGGDYNNNNKVEASDYVLWRKTPNAFGGTPAGYNNWRSNFGTGTGSGNGVGGGSSAVPEPGTCVLMIFAALITLTRVRPRSLNRAR
jgi:fibronectin-binding autotransporter adhesin